MSIAKAATAPTSNIATGAKRKGDMMVIEKKPFRSYGVERKSDVFTIKLNEDERKEFEKWKNILQQEKDSTAMKQLAEIGAKVLLDEKPTTKIIEVILNNYRKNKRLNIVTFD